MFVLGADAASWRRLSFRCLREHTEHHYILTARKLSWQTTNSLNISVRLTFRLRVVISRRSPDWAALLLPNSTWTPRRYWRRFLLVFSWRFAACWRFPSSTVLHSYSHRSTSFTISFSSRTEESSVSCRAATNDSSWINFSKFYSLQMSLLVPTVQNQKRELQCSSAQGPAAPLVFSAQTFKSPRQTPRSHAEDLGFNEV